MLGYSGKNRYYAATFLFLRLCCYEVILREKANSISHAYSTFSHSVRLLLSFHRLGYSYSSSDFNLYKIALIPPFIQKEVGRVVHIYPTKGTGIPTESINMLSRPTYMVGVKHLY